MSSFIRKYKAITQMPENIIQSLFKFRPVIIGTHLKMHGALFRFHYTLHTIPCIGFTI